MTEESRPAVLPRRTRPRDRRDQIIAAATDLYCRHGYPAVSMSDVAHAVDVQPSALYRHFAGKQDLLLAAVEASLEPGAGMLTAGRRQDDLDGVLSELAAGALDQRHLGVLWQRESRHLSTEQRSDLRDRIRDAVASLCRTIEAERPELDLSQADMLTAGVFAVLISVSYQRAEVPRPEYVTLLHELASGIARAEIPAVGGEAVARPVGFGLSSRREVLIAAATGLFAERGFGDVGADDISAAAGLAPASFYHHFKGKADLLWAVLVRGDQTIRTDMSRALRAARDPQDALRRAFRAYVDVALDSPELIEAMIWQVPHLPADRRAVATEMQRELVGEWLALLGRARPEVGRAHARVLVQAALTIVNNVAMTPRLRAVPEAAEALGVMVDVVLEPRPGRLPVLD